MSSLSHFDDSGASRMVDVGTKDVTQRLARVEAIVRMDPSTLAMIQDQQISKGNVFEVSRLAGIMAAKRTGELIPLCHPLGIDSVTIDFKPIDESSLRIESRVTVSARTGVEMEAMTAASVAALTIYDMCKAVDRKITIGPIRLVEKSGGKSGHFIAD